MLAVHGVFAIDKVLYNYSVGHTCCRGYGIEKLQCACIRRQNINHEMPFYFLQS